jgi:hypothetical protein
MVPPHPVTRLVAVAEGLRALAAEIQEIQGEPPLNLLWWAEEIDRAILDLRRATARLAPTPATSAASLRGTR